VSQREILASLLSGVALALLPAQRAVAAEPPRWHLELGGAHAVADPQDREYGPGTEGRLAAELALGRIFGLQVEGGSLWLAHTNAPMDPSLADHGDGSALFAMGGLRVRPLFDVAGPWLDANVGYVRTGTLDRAGFDGHVGYDWRVGQGRWDVGPYVGYFQIVQPGDALRPQDAHVLSVGIHVALGASRTPPPVSAVEPPPPPPPPPEPAPPSDRDGDGIVDEQDACPDVAGPRSDDPALNGCPPRSDAVRVVDDRIEYGEVILFETDRAEVEEGAWPMLRNLAKFMIGNPQIEEVEITGHADERGSEDHNLRLSAARAEAVRTLLVSFGVESTRLTPKGFGFRRPRAQGHTEDDWRQNRRVEFRISKLHDAQGRPPAVPGSQGVHP
jgi:outer membrane protein OmpA-like peptidoglycan-associated protein